MAYSSPNQTSDVEVILVNTDLEDVSKENKNTDFVDDWLNGNVTIENEIWRGKKLSEEKPIPDDTKYELKGHPKSSKYESSSCTFRSRSYQRQTSATSNYLTINRIRTNTPKMKPKNSKRCPMRIAELAVPTKRQCIDTWRNKSCILPEFMVERLKQHVMDQRPIVKIPDALYSFQRRRPKSSKNCSFRRPQSKSKNINEVLKPCQMNTEMLCITFAHKIATRLSKPLNLTLSSDLEKISRIVASDIAKILGYKCKCNFSDNLQYKAIHTDVSNKITVWIAAILEDLSNKLLEEDLKDLEEEEGPVLDFIDEVVHNVMNICEPPPLHVDSESDIMSGFSKDVLLGEESEKLLAPIESSVKNMMESEEIFNTVEATQGLMEETDDALTDADHFRNEINNIIDNSIKESGDNISNRSGDDDMRNENKEEISLKAENKYDINDGNNEEIPLDTENKHNINYENNEEISLNAEKKQDTNDENYDDISLKEEMEHDINDKFLSEAGIEHDVNDENNEEISLKAEKKQDINDGNNEEIPLNTENKHHINDENNEEISLKTEKKQDINNENYEEISLREDMEHDINNKFLPEAGIEHDVNDENNEEISPEAGTNHDKNEENIAQINDNSQRIEENYEVSDNAEKSDTNVSERFEIFMKDSKSDSKVNEYLEIFTDDSDDDKNSKKVMFSLSHLVNPDNTAKKIKTNITEELEHDEHEQAQRNPQNIFKSKIFFAEPNQNLLSYADESWPADLSSRSMLKISASVSKSITSLGKITEHEIFDEKQISQPEANWPADLSSRSMLKISASVSKSITSLGKITEHEIFDEKQISQPEEANVTDKGKSDTKSQIEDIVEKMNITLPTEKLDTGSQSNEPMIIASKKTTKTILETGVTHVNTETLDKKYIGKSITVSKTCDDKPVDETFKQDQNQTASRESDLIRTGNTGRTEDDNIPKHKTQSWKVHPKTAPSWVASWGQGRGEPSVDSILTQIRPTQVTESKMRKWCKNLQKAFINLEMWSQWISNTCKESIFLMKQKELACPNLAQRGAINWMSLKRNIHKDVLLWTKLYKRTENNFTSLKRKYNNVEIIAAEYSAMCTCDKTQTRYRSNKIRYT